MAVRLSALSAGDLAACSIMPQPTPIQRDTEIVIIFVKIYFYFRILYSMTLKVPCYRNARYAIDSVLCVLLGHLYFE
jgi:hypothetical protein